MDEVDEDTIEPRNRQQYGSRPPQFENFGIQSEVDMEFQNLEYSIYDSASLLGHKQILKKINGIFKSGNLSAILGASGSGKTSLLNILAGYLFDGVSGSIKINGIRRNMDTFKKVTCYITQENYLQPYLSVGEAMRIAANLRLRPDISTEDRQSIIQGILDTLGLNDCSRTRTECLSGGERKRFSLALELINNPPVIFLDEPVTGLDCVSADKCINILRQLCLSQKKTIVCSVHQPSKYIFDMFDQVYFLSNGSCVYNGSPSKLEPHLSANHFVCPVTWNPADYLIEITCDENITLQLKTSVSNGKINCQSSSARKSQFSEESKVNLSVKRNKAFDSECVLDFPVSFLTQLRILLGMMYLQTRRNRKGLIVQFINHFLLGLITGGLFWNSGQIASMAVENFFFYLTVTMFFIYTYTMSSVLLFPKEVQIFKREYANRWYSLKAYYTAIIVRNIPIMVVYGLVFNTLVYVLTGQQGKIYHFGLFSLTTLLISMTSEALGTSIGSLFSITYGSIAAPVILAPLVMFSLYGIGDGEKNNPVMDVLISFSYVRSGFTALCRLMLANQSPLQCPDDYCHYKDTNLLLRDMGMAEKRFYLEIMYICIFAVLCRILGYVALKFRVRSDFDTKIKILVNAFLAKSRR